MPATTDGLPYGPMLVGTYLDAILYGVMIPQVLFYFQNYNKDRAALRCLILYLFFIETINTGIIIALLYQPLITNFDTPSSSFPLLLPSDAIVTVLISTPIQIFLAWRIRIISQSIWVGLSISVLAVTSLAGGLWMGVSVQQISQHTQELLHLRWPVLTWLVTSALADTALTGSLVFYLARRKSGFVPSDDMINKIIRVTVQTGLITAVFAILNVGCFLTLPNSSLNFIWDFPLSKLYTNAFISTLNARARWGKLIDDNPSQPLSQLAFRAPDLPVSTGVSSLESGSTLSQHKPEVLQDGSRRSLER